MKYICNQCSNVFQADDITIHYISTDNRLEIIAICPSCLKNYMKKTKTATEQKEDDSAMRKMERKW